MAMEGVDTGWQGLAFYDRNRLNSRNGFAIRPTAQARLLRLLVQRVELLYSCRTDSQEIKVLEFGLMTAA